MSPKIQLPAPKTGLSFDTANAEQPPLTTALATDVRLIDARTGRSRIASRAGMRKFWSNSLGSRIDYVTAVPYNAPKVEYTPLTEVDNSTTTPAVLAEDRAISLPSFGRAVRADFQGNIYVFLDDNRIQVFNSDLVLLDTITPPLKPGETCGQTLAVDEARRVYTACASETGTTSRVFQWIRVEDPERPDFTFFDLRWILDVPGQIGEIVAQAGALWITRNLQSGESVAHVTKYSGLQGTTPPLEEWDSTAPFPIRDHAISETGEVYGTSPSNPNRGAAPDLGGLHTPVTSWTPHDIGYDAAAYNADRGSEHRLHAWVDAHFIQNIGPGDFVTTVPDRRYIATQNSSPDGGQPPGSSAGPPEYFDGPTDTINRPIYSLHNTDATHRIGPQYFPTGIAGLPALYFSRIYDPNNTGYPGMVLRSSLNTGPEFKQDTTGPQSLGTDSDSANYPLTTSWTDIAAIGIAIGAGFEDGVMTAHVTGLVRTGLGTSTLQLRVSIGGAPTGLAVSLDFPVGDHNFNVSLPIAIPATSGGTYGLQARLGGGIAVTILGATTPTAYELIFNDVNPDQDGLLPSQPAIVPGQSGAGGNGDSWTALSSWRIFDTKYIGVMAYQKGNVHRWALLSNARISTGVLHQEDGWIAFVSNQMSGGDSQSIQITGDPFNTWAGVSFDTDPVGDNPGKHAIVDIQCVRSFAGDADLQSFFRLNGRAAGRFTIAQIEAWGAESMVVIGNKHRLTLPDASDLWGPAVPFQPFDGYFVTWQTQLGYTTNTASNANDAPTVGPTTGGLPYPAGSDSGTIDPTTYDTVEPDTAGSYTGSATEIERLEGGMAHDCGMSNIFPNGNAETAPTPPYDNHPFGGFANPPTGFAEPVTISDLDRVLRSPRPILWKLGSSGAGFVWALNGSGLGHSVISLPDRYVASVGERDPQDARNEDVVLRRIFDGGQTYSLATTDGAWVYRDALIDMDFDQPQLVSDDAGQVYWPIAQLRQLVKHRGSTGTRLWTYTGVNGSNIRQASLEPDTPVWPESSDEEDRSPIFAYLAGDGLRKLRMVAETQVIGASASPRKHRYIAVAGQGIYEGPPGGVALSVPGGGMLFDLDRTFVTGAELFPKHYLTDGRNYAEFDPVTNTAHRLDTGKRGEPPKRGRLIAGWLGRLIIARTQDDESTLFASAVDDATDWDYFPVNPTVGDAWNSTLGIGPGSPPDLITALMVLDDILIVGCDHSIYKLVGDPRDGGRIELVSEQTGIAFGRAWNRDTDGLVYFFGQRGGIWALSRGLDSLVEARRISEYKVERRLQKIDLSTKRVEQVWDYHEEGLRSYVIPYAR